MKSKNNTLQHLGLIALAFAGFAANSAQAATEIWTGATNTWNTAGNWTGTNLPPISGDSLTFNAAGAGGTTLNNDLTSAAFNVAGITFNSTASAYTLGGNAFTLTGNITNSSTTNAQIINDAMAFTAQRTIITSNAAAGITLGGLLSGTGGSLLVQGSGTVTISNANNSYTGGTIIGASGTGVGVVRAAATQALGSGTISYDGSGGSNTLRLELINGISLNNAITLTGKSVLNASIQNISGDNTLSGTITGITGGANYNFQSDAGKLTLGTASATAITSAAASRVVNFSGAGDFEVAGNITNGGGTLSVTKSGAGTLTLSGTNAYLSGTAINGGIVALASGIQALGGSGTVGTVGTITWGGGTLQFGASNTTDYSSRFSEASGSAYKLDTNGQTVAWGTGRTPTGTGSLTKFGAGTLNVTTSANAWTGATTIEAGTLQVAGLAAININSSIGKGSVGGSAADLVFGGGTLQYAGSSATTTNRLFTIGDANGLTATLDASGTTSSNTMSFTGTGSLGLGGSGARTLTLTGSNTGSNTLASILGDGSGGTTALTKSGAGTWVLSGANTYTGQTTIKGGTLKLNSTGTIANSSSIVVGDTGSTGAVLDLTDKSAFSFVSGQKVTGIGDINIGSAKTITIASSATLAPSAQATGSKLDADGKLDFASGSIFEWDLNATNGSDLGVVSNSGNYGQLAATGAATGTAVFNIVLGSNSYSDAFWNTNKSWDNIFSASGLTDLTSLFTTFSGSGLTPTGSGATAIATATGQGYFSFSGTSLNWSAVPEPTSALAGLLLGAGLLRRRRKN